MAQEGVGGERTERATPKKRKDAREKGQVRKSQEVVTALMMIALFGALLFLGSYMWGGMHDIMRSALSGELMIGDAPTIDNMGALLLNIGWDVALIILPILGVSMIMGIGANLLQVGFLFAPKALMPKFSKLNPISGFKRMFSINTLFELAKSIFKVAIIASVAYSRYIYHYNHMAATGNQLPQDALRDIWRMIVETGLIVGLCLLILSAFDFFYQWWKYEKDLKMTKYEVKMEHKQQEGDPQIKGKIRQKQRQMAMMRMMQAIPEADVVITNPTHFAVALKYDEDEAPAPIVTAKGQDYLAKRIRMIAEENGVEVVENKEVARSLYALCEVGSEVPMELYQAVAEILAYVYKLKNK